MRPGIAPRMPLDKSHSIHHGRTRMLTDETPSNRLPQNQKQAASISSLRIRVHRCASVVKPVLPGKRSIPWPLPERPVPNHDVRRAPYALISRSEGVRSKSHDISTRGPDLRTRPHDCFGCEPMFHLHRTIVLRSVPWCRLNGTTDQDTNKACNPS